VLRSLRVWVGLVVSLCFIALFLFRSDPGKMVDALRGADYAWFAPAIVLYLVSVWVRSVRYRFLVKDLADLSSWKLFPVLCIAFMANNLLPARAGELVRAYVMGEKYHVSKVSALGTVVVERLCDGLTLLLMLVGTVLVLGANATLRGLAALSFVIFVAALGVFAAIIVRPAQSRRLLYRLLHLLPDRFAALGRQLVDSLFDGMMALRHPETLAAVLICSPLAWGMEAVVFQMIGRAFGIQLNLGWFMMALAAGNLALTAPSSQGGIGPFEFFAKQVLVFAGVTDSVAAAYTLAVHAVIIVPITLLGLVFLTTIHISLGTAVKEGAAEAAQRQPAAASKTTA
jgi:uncharacterized protein (TIRG00374 family)